MSLLLLVVEERQGELFQVVAALGAAGGLAGGLHSRQQQPDQHPDDRHHHEQFNQGEAAVISEQS